MYDAVTEGNAFDEFGHAVSTVELSPLRLDRHHQLETRINLADF